MRLDFTVDTVPFDVIVAQQQLIEQVYQQDSQLQQMGPSNPQTQPASQTPAGGQQ